jgi:hypothetical protein
MPAKTGNRIRAEDWRSPPVVASVNAEMRAYCDGRRVHLIAWRAKNATVQFSYRGYIIFARLKRK